MDISETTNILYFLVSFCVVYISLLEVLRFWLHLVQITLMFKPVAAAALQNEVFKSFLLIDPEIVS